MQLLTFLEHSKHGYVKRSLLSSSFMSGMTFVYDAYLFMMTFVYDVMSLVLTLNLCLTIYTTLLQKHE